MLTLLVVSACDPSGPDSISDSASNEAPEASFAISDSEPRAGEKVTLDASGSSDPDGDIENYLWDFGADGGSEKTGQQVTWRFETEDTTGVQLTVTDSDGADVSTEREVRIRPGVRVKYTYAPEDPRAGDQVTFDASSSEDPLGQIQAYEWDFNGDGSPDATGETATWTFGYERGDSASVSLTVTGEENARETSEKDLSLLPLQISLQVNRPRVTQSVQRYEGEPVPLVAGRDGLLRVFLSAGQDNPYSPKVKVKLFHDGMPVETLTASSERTVPTDPKIGELEDSWNAVIPGELVQPGLSVLVQASPDNGIPLTGDGQTQFPADGEPLELDVHDTPPLRLTMVPIYVSATGETGNVSEGNLETYLERPRDLFPVSSFEVSVRSTYTTNIELDEDFASNLLGEIEALRTAQGSERHYYGVFGEDLDGWGGSAYRPGRAAIGVEESTAIMAHELGHNFDQLHTPCGDAPNLDFGYPYPDANIGRYGAKVGEGKLLAPDKWKDLMSYCSPQWISDYIYTSILNFRQDRDGTSTERYSKNGQDTEESVLLLWGSTANGKVTLEPAFEIDSPPKLPSGSGPYTLKGFDELGTRLFSFSFSGTKVADGAPAERSFVFAIPQSRVGGDQLARLEVSGNGSSATLRSGIAHGKTRPLSESAGDFSIQSVRRGTARLQWSDPDYRAVMVRDADTGEILSIARDGDTRMNTGIAETVTLLFSDGVRTTQRRVNLR